MRKIAYSVIVIIVLYITLYCCIFNVFSRTDNDIYQIDHAGPNVEYKVKPPHWSNPISAMFGNSVLVDFLYTPIHILRMKYFLEIW